MLEGLEMMRALRERPVLVGDVEGARGFDAGSLELARGELGLCFEQKLGHLYEDVLERMLRATPRYQLLASGLQVREGKRTLGELDFVFVDGERGVLVHLELAVKFYLAWWYEGGGRWRFPGPDARDDLGRKLQRLCGHQLALSSAGRGLEMVRELAADAGYDGWELERRLLVPGVLYGRKGEEFERPQGVRAGFRRRRWARVQELLEEGVERVALVPKYWWLVEMTAELARDLVWMGGDELVARVQRRGELVWVADGRMDGELVFVVGDGWPNFGDGG